MAGGISAGIAYVDVLPNMRKFGPALAAETKASSGALAKFGKTGALALGAVGVGSVALAADFEKSMRNVNSIARLPEPAFDRLNDRVLDLAGPTAQAPKTLAEGLYDLVSSGFEANESLKILRASALAATAGLTTTDVSTKAVAAVLNAYRLPASKATEVSDTLFKTVDRGVITFEELANGIGDTLPFAASLGVGLDEVGAATATMTKQGLGASETFTRVRNLLQTMIKPGEDLSKAIEQLGYESGEALVKEEGLQGALEAVIGTTNGTKDEVAKLFPNIRALGGALALTGDNASAARKDLDGMRDSAGATQAAFEEQSKSLAVQWERLKANLSALAIRIGNVLLPVITDAVRWLNEDLGPALSSVGRIASRVGGAIAGAFRGAVGWVKTAVANVSGFLRDFIPLKVAAAAVKVAIAALTPVLNQVRAVGRVALSVLTGAFRIATSVVRGLITFIGNVGAVLGDVVGVATNLLRGDFAGAWRAVRELAASFAGLVRGAVAAALNNLKAAFGAVRGVGTAAFNAVKGAVDGLIGVVRSAIGVVGDLLGALDSAIDKAGEVLGIGQDTVEKWQQARVAIATAETAAAGANVAAAVASAAGKRALGGPVSARSSYIVGERGPELFRPSIAGRIIPNSRLAGAVGGSGRRVLVIENWRDGVGFIREVADDRIDASARYDRSRERQRR